MTVEHRVGHCAVNSVNEVIAQCRKSPRFTRLGIRGGDNRFGKARRTGNVDGPGPHIALLPAAMQYRYEFDVRPHEQRAYSHRTADLVTGDRHR